MEEKDYVHRKEHFNIMQSYITRFFFFFAVFALSVRLYRWFCIYNPPAILPICMSLQYERKKTFGVLLFYGELSRSIEGCIFKGFLRRLTLW